MIHLLQNHAYGSQFSPIIDIVSISVPIFQRKLCCTAFLDVRIYVCTLRTFMYAFMSLASQDDIEG